MQALKMEEKGCNLRESEWPLKEGKGFFSRASRKEQLC